jgi:hypothetical protein
MCLRLIGFALLTSASLLTHANNGIVRCIDEDGNALYTDSTCPAGMRAGGSLEMSQSCTSEECERRRELDLQEARERARAEKEQLDLYRTERHKREIEDRWLDEARYEAELRSKESLAGNSGEVLDTVVMQSSCGARCRTHAKIADADLRHHRMKRFDERRDLRIVAKEVRDGRRSRTNDRRSGHQAGSRSSNAERRQTSFQY